MDTLNVIRSRKLAALTNITTWDITCEIAGIEYNIILDSYYEPNEDEIALYLLNGYHFNEDEGKFCEGMVQLFGKYTDEMMLDYNDNLALKVEIEHVFGHEIMEELTEFYTEIGMW